MRFIAYNIVPILLVGLAGLLIYLNKEGWGWCVFAAVCTAVYPTSKCECDE